jgi:GT2 family glycosyltransferase
VKATLALLTYDGREMLAGALPSVASQTFPDGEVEIVVVDNGSSDGTAQWLAKEWPVVRVVRLEENVGVAGALNHAWQAATGDYVALLNNDLELAPGWLEALARTLEEHPGAASATGKMLRHDRRDVIDAAGDFILGSGVSLNRGAGERDDGQYDVAGEVFSACGGAALYRRAALEDVGGFDASFFAYLEDADWGFRARLRGWSARYEPAAVAYHMGSATTTKRKGLYGRMQRRNHVALMLKNLPAASLLRHGPAIVLYQLAWFAASALRDGMGGAHARALWEALVRLPQTLRDRRAIQARRTARVADVEAALAMALPSGRFQRLAVQVAPELARRRSSA